MSMYGLGEMFEGDIADSGGPSVSRHGSADPHWRERNFWQQKDAVLVDNKLYNGLTFGRT